MATMNISLPDKMREYVEQQVATGKYANASDYMRDLIRYNQRENENLQAQLQTGLESGISGMSVDEIFEKVKKRYIEN